MDKKCNQMNIPDLIDNDKVTLKDVLNSLLQSPVRLYIATAYFNIEAFEALPDIENVEALRILLGKEQDQKFVVSERLKEELKDASESAKEGFIPSLKKWEEFIKQDKVEIKRVESEFLHGKAYLLSGIQLFGKIGIIGSSNFTRAGLEHNRELNAVLKQQSATSELEQWFEKQWSEAKDCKGEILELLSDFTKEYTPYEVYIKIIYEALKDKLDQEKLAEKEDKPSPIVLADFQTDGYLVAKDILERYGGVMLADSVGLGKTYLALKLLDDYAYHRHQTALVVCPAQLKDTLWEPLLREKGIPNKIVTMEKISQSNFNIEECKDFKVIVIDEAHNFRNDKTNRWENIYKLLKFDGTAEKKIILLTATPINNTVFDLYNQIRLLTYDQEDFFESAGIPKLREYFYRAAETKENLYEIAEAIMVRRSRQFIKKNYPNSKIDGKIIKFPARKIHSCSYSLEKSYRGLYEEVASAIENLFLAPYQIDRYRKEILLARQLEFDFADDKKVSTLVDHLKKMGWGEKEAHDFCMLIRRQTSLADIMRVLYLKRLESSVEALRISLDRQKRFQKKFLKALEQGRLLTSKDYHKFYASEQSDDLEEKGIDFSNLSQLDINKYDVDAIKKAVNVDIKTLSDLIEKLDKLKPDQDDKLQVLKKYLTTDLKDKKVIVFSYFKDTARYIYKELLNDNSFLKALGHKQLSIVDSEVKPEERKDRLTRFAPIANNRLDIKGTAREINLLISTDVLSEGQNLQDANIVINYDLHWNPIRMVQRVGRLDRIGSGHPIVHTYNFSPEDKLDSLLQIMERLYKKLEDINKAIGLDASVLGELPSPRDFNALLHRIAEEDQKVIDELEAESEFNVGEFLTQDVLNYLKAVAEEKLQRMPTGIALGSAKRGDTKGCFASFRVRKTGQHFWLFLDETKNKVIFQRLEAVRHIRCGKDEKREHTPIDVNSYIYKLKKELLTRLQRMAYKIPSLSPPQNHIIIWLQTLPSSEMRNELLEYFRKPLDKLSLRELKKKWQEIKTLPDSKRLEELKSFTSAHPRPDSSQSAYYGITEEDLELIGWMAVV